jgi:hypothetical protein
MKTITFRPLRRVKKLNRIVVASYSTWRNVMTADYNKFNLVLSDEHKALPPDEFVYNHKGELLFWFNINPADIPIFDYNRLLDFDAIRAKHKWYGTLWTEGQHVNYMGPGLDCSGVPCFSHYTQEQAADPYFNPNEFEPLKVKTVIHWYGWFLLHLNNSYLQKK